MNYINGILGNVSEADSIIFSDEELAGALGEIGRAMRSPDKRLRSRAHAAWNRIASRKLNNGVHVVEKRPPETKNLTAKALFERRLAYVDKDTRKAYADGDIATTGDTIYSVKLATGNRVEMFESGDTKKEGRTNIDRRQLPNGSTMLVTAITLLSGTGAGATPADGDIVDFSTIHPVIANGNFNFKNGQKFLMEENATHIFKHIGHGDVEKGKVILDNPKIIEPGKDIIYDIDMPNGIPANTFIRVMLHGLVTVKA